MKKKIFSMLLAITMIAAILPIGIFSASAVEGKLVDEAFYQFAEEVTDLTEEKGEVAASSEEDAEGTFALKRLIVKAKGSIDDFGAISKAEGYFDLHVFQYATVEETESAYNKYLKLKAVEYVEPDEIVEISSYTEKEAIVSADSYDEYKSWGANVMGIEEYKATLPETLPEVIVAVIDTGIDTDHEMFGGFYNATTNPNGRILPYGEDFVNGDGDDDHNPEDDKGHGTHVSGTIAEITENNVKILPIKVLDSNGSGLSLHVALGMSYAVLKGADIVNMSLGGEGTHKTYEDIVNDAYDTGTTFVVAAGNDDDDAENHTPANIEKCITVSAVDSLIERASFSNYGEMVDIAAPGVSIESAYFNGGYESMSGTSMASPHIAGLAALFLTKDNTMSVQELEEEIKSNTHDMGDKGFDKYYGYGLAYAKERSVHSFARVDFDKKSGDYEAGIEISMIGSKPGVTIYYTLDGTEPSSISSEYTGPITINKTSLVRAVAYEQKNGSQIQSFFFAKEEYYIAGTEQEVLWDINSEGTLLGYNGELFSKLVIPSEVNSISVIGIGEKLFNRCSDLSSVTIPDSVMSISWDAFDYCTRLTAINITTDNSKYSSDDGVLFNKNKTELITFPDGKSGEYGVPNGVTSIENCAFDQCNKLKSVTISNSVISIGISAFSLCKKLESITIGNGVEEIGMDAFYGCEDLEIVMLGNGLKKIDAYAFLGCESLKSITIPGSVTEINDFAIGYYADNGEGVLVEGFIIYGIEGTTAETYARDNGIEFRSSQAQYTVTFRDYNGDILKTQTVDHGGSVTPPANPTRTGYTFEGWRNTDGRIITDFRNITSDLTFTASYGGDMCMVTFLGGKDGKVLIKVAEVEVDGKVVLVPSKDEVKAVGKSFFKVFTGRWLDKEGKAVNPTTVTITEDVTFRAEYMGWFSYVWAKITGKV